MLVIERTVFSVHSVQSHCKKSKFNEITLKYVEKKIGIRLGTMSSFNFSSYVKKDKISLGGHLHVKIEQNYEILTEYLIVSVNFT